MGFENGNLIPSYKPNEFYIFGGKTKLTNENTVYLYNI